MNPYAFPAMAQWYTDKLTDLGIPLPLAADPRLVAAVAAAYTGCGPLPALASLIRAVMAVTADPEASRGTSD